MLVDGATALSANTQEEQCNGMEAYWYERTPYRKIPFSSCEGGDRPDRGKQHACPGLIGGKGVGAFFWGTIAIIPFAFAALGGWWWFKKGGRTSGWVHLKLIASSSGVTANFRSIRLGEHRAFGGDSDLVSTLTSVFYVVRSGLQEGWAWVERKVPFIEGLFSSRTPYRSLPLDDDAEVLGAYDDE